MHIGIIGAGASGLAAAHRLKKAGHRVVVYEASDRVGGVIRSTREGGFLAEAGPHSIMDQENRIAPMLPELGLEKEKIAADSCAARRYIVRDRKLIAAPDSPGSFFLSDLFSLGAKLRVLQEPFIAARAEPDEENLANFVRRRLGPEILAYGVDPLVAGVYAGDPEKLSVQHAFPKLHAMEREHGSLYKAVKAARESDSAAGRSAAAPAIYTFREGLAALPEALHARLREEVMLQTPVTSISHDVYGWIVGCVAGGVEQAFRHDALLATTPAWQLPNIRFYGDGFRALSTLRLIAYPPVAAVTLGFRRADVAHPLDGFGMLVPRAEGLSILGTLFTSSLFPNRAPEGHILLTNFCGGTRNPGAAQRTPEAVLEMTMHDLRLLLGVTGDPVFVHLDRHAHAIPQYEVGYGKHIGAMKRLERENPGFFMAGNFRNGTSVSQAFGSGLDAADRITAHFNRTKQPGAPGQERRSA